MKLLKAKIKGLIGLSRGSNIKEIDIDFTKCKNNITLIMGGNGSGKSTLLSVLHPLPDPPSMFIEKEEGYEKFSYISNNTIYNILIQYPVNRHGERTTTKAYLQKVVNGVPSELNPNGNVTSYKDCIYSEFKLDSNFEALTRLSLEDKGIVSKTPAERTKFVASILRDTDAYTNIYKALNKRSSVFKSMMNNLISKIGSIGSEENLEHTLNSMNMRIDALSNSRDLLLKKLSSAESMMQQLDMGGEIQTKYNELYSKLQSVNTQLETIDFFIEKYMVEPYEVYIKTYEVSSNSHIILEREVASLQSRIDSEKDSLQTLLREKEEDSKTLTIKINKVESLRSQYNFEEMFKLLKATKDRIKQFIAMLNELGLTEETTLTKDEFILGLSTLKDIKGQIDSFRSIGYDSQINDAIEYILNSDSPMRELTSLNDKHCSLNDSIATTKELISYNKGLLDRSIILSQRPDKCKIDDCPFIEDALLAIKEDPENQLQELEESLQLAYQDITKISEREKYLNDILAITQSLNIILRMINNNRFILDKLPNGRIFTDTEFFLEQLRNGSPFNEIHDLYNYIDQANLFEQYRKDKEDLVRLESEYEIYKNRSSIIDEISADIEDLQKGLFSMVEKVEQINSSIFRMEKELQNKQLLLQIVIGVKTKYEQKKSLLEEKNFLEDSIHSMYNNMQAIEQSAKDINDLNSQLLNVDNELKPIREERETIKFSLAKLKEYNDELAIFTAKYNKVEVIKRYSNPSKEGIQKLFVDIYMGQTLSIANKLLSMFFGGKLKLLKYDISDNQFRIPCASEESSLINDDVSSCSGGEKSMLAMILSFALLQQSSTLYNILRLDEIDGTLDQSNRAMFVEVLSIIIEELHMDNCFMISHASESSLDNVDVICLNMDELTPPRGNIIYSTI